MSDAVFLPGIILPAAIRYEPLLRALDGGVRGVTKELEVYAADTPAPDYSIRMEVDGVERTADEAGFGRFHLYGHSGGGAIALAFAAAHPRRLLSLAVDEPAVDFLGYGNEGYWLKIKKAASLPEPNATREFLRLQLADDEPLPPPPDGPAPPWMSKRSAGIRAFIAAAESHHVEPAEYRAFRAPVYYSYGTRSHPHWIAARDRLAELFEDFTAERYEGLHHLNTSHQAEPGRVATALKTLWASTGNPRRG
jgi:pimeloyl-ACP methyl ester carboxylesterase